MIKFYSSPNCPYCFTLKMFLKEHGIQFEDIDIAKNKQAVKEVEEKTGKYEVPVLDIDGQIIEGFDREEICKLLNIKD
ncbi:glutathione S-transferase N-terminal domain-containing protein [Candidatus Parcubacteria bacterium]|nr:glutathione S-transferase N-terminal domain-containing protein [Candidatus Parcubacteria bacterium]